MHGKNSREKLKEGGPGRNHHVRWRSGGCQGIWPECSCVIATHTCTCTDPPVGDYTFIQRTSPLYSCKLESGLWTGDYICTLSYMYSA